jgi:hypothetical protein
MTTRFFGGQAWRWREAAHLPGQRQKPTLFVIGNGEDPFAEHTSLLEVETMFRSFRANIRTHKFMMVIEDVPRALARLDGRTFPNNVILAGRVQKQSDISDVLVPVLRIKAAHHAVLADPLVSPIDLPGSLLAPKAEGKGIGWVIVGCSPKKANDRLLRTDYLLNLLHDCDEAGVPVWVHNVGGALRDHSVPCRECGEDELAHEPGQANPFTDETTAATHPYAANNIVRMSLGRDGSVASEWPAAIRRQQRPVWLDV